MAPALQEQTLQGRDVVRLQLNELIAAADAKSSLNVPLVNQKLERIRTIISNVPDHGPIPITSAHQFLNGSTMIQIPFVHKLESDTNIKVSFVKPSGLHEIKPHVIRDRLGPSRTVIYELCIPQPSQIFQEKDYLDYRYFHKRSFYLAWIAQAIQKEDESFILAIESCDGNDLIPVLHLTHPDLFSTDSKIVIRLRPVCSPSQFQSSKTLPERSNVRYNEEGSADKNGFTQNVQGPTPFYNASLRADCAYISQLASIDQVKAKCPSFSDACSLGRVWLEARGMHSDIRRSGFGQHEWNLFSAALMQTGAAQGQPYLASHLDSYGIFRSVITLLASKNMAEAPFTLWTSETPTGLPLPIAYDGQSQTNILYKMTRWGYIMLQRESKHSVSCLTRNPDDIFRLVFVNRINHSLLKYDQIYRVPGNHLARMSSSNLRGESKAMTVTQKIFDVLDRGLQGRIESLEFVFSNITSAFISEKGAPIGDLTIGLFVKPENINRSIDKGPLIEQKELASEFRRFWGKRAEARQFKDGTTVECVLWDQSSALPVLEQIILYLFARHFSASVETSKHLYQTQFRTCFRQELSHMDASLHLYDRIRKDSEKLSQSLQDIAKQPLQIRQISPISAHSRQTSIKLTKSYGNSLLPLDPIELNVQFEGSSGWPSQISAVQRTKIAFLLKIREVMEEAEVDLSESSVGLERTNSEFCNIAFLDVKYPGGLLFRIRIHHEGEEQLLKQMAESSSEGPRVQDEASASLESYRRDFINRGLLTQLVSTLSTKFPALPPTIRITKHWFASHMLLPHFDEELVEIFCIHVFTQPHPWKTPGSPENGFFRVVHMLARWNWALEPLLVNLSTESRISTSGLRLMRNHFVSLRKIDPVFNRIALFVGTNIDHEGISWTRRRPQKVVAARMTMLARALDDAICYSDPHVLNLSHFLTSRLSDFDFTIHLKPKFYNLSSEQDLSTERSKSYKNLITQNEVSISLDRRSLADTYFAELETRFSASALFFRDPVETKVIAGLWLREKGSRNWKPSLAYSSEPVASSKTNAEVQINKEATLNDIARLGGDMVSKYELF